MPKAHPVHALSSELVDELAALDPTAATHLGIEGHDDRWPDLSPSGAAASLDALRAMRRRITELPPATERWDQLAVDVAGTAVEEAIDVFEHEDHQTDLRSMASPPQDLREAFDVMPRDTPEQIGNVIARLAGLDAALAGYRQTLQQGIADGNVVARRQVEAVAEQCDVHTSDDSAFVGLLRDLETTPAAHPWRRRLEEATLGARHAYGELAAFLRNEYLPHARQHDAVGAEAYARWAERHLGTAIDTAETYAWGWSEVAELRARLAEVAGEIVPGGDPGAAAVLLKTDPARQAANPKLFCELMQERNDEAVAGLAGVHFDVPDHMREVRIELAPPGGALGAYYVGPSEDFSRPGTLWWALDGDGPVPLFDQVSTLYHEGFPGHHLQVGTQVSLADRLSRLHRMWVWTPGSGEGWALYAERLMDELGFLDRPDYVFGLLAGQMLRACRIVIDIGSHLELPIPTDQPFRPGGAWTFEAAVEMLVDVAALEPAYARSEVTRYLGWPGQAISYKVGERAILELRELITRQDGAAFDLRRFHGDLLEVGPVGIDVMRRHLLG